MENKCNPDHFPEIVRLCLHQTLSGPETKYEDDLSSPALLFSSQVSPEVIRGEGSGQNVPGSHSEVIRLGGHELAG